MVRSRRVPENITWWELCERVAEALRREPQNYCQVLWEIPKEHRAVYNLPTEGRGCGTAYCIAGWMGHIMCAPWADLLTELSKVLNPNHYNWTQGSVYRLTSGGVMWDYFPEDGGESIVGTPEYAEQGIKHLRTWMQIHEEVLRKTVVQTRGA